MGSVKLVKLRKALNFRSQRTVYERINVVKTLALSKVILIRSFMETPPNFSNEVGTKWF